MAKLQGFKRIVMEDYPTQYRDIIQKLGYSINNFAKNVVDTLNNNQVTIADNLNIKQKTLMGIVVNNIGVPNTNIDLKTGLDHNCVGITVIRTVNVTNPATVQAGVPYITFSELNGVLSISNITNLVAGNTYNLTMILF